MPVRLKAPYQGQAANTLYWGTDEETLLATGGADTFIEQAADYGSRTRIVTSATGITTRNAVVYRMNSGTAQTLTINPSGGYWLPGDVLTVVQEGTGATTITAGSGVTINTAATGLKTQGQWTVAQLINRGKDLWVAIGSVGA